MITNKNDAPNFRLEKVDRKWGRRIALQEVNLTIEAGERVALIGPSGSGKSTLIRLLAGALAPSGGRVLADDLDLSQASGGQLRRHRRRCGYVAQGGHLVPQLNVHRNVLAGLVPKWRWYRTVLSLVWPVERGRVAAMLDRVGLADRQWDSASILSGGQQQRVAIARGLIGAPSVVFADEPTASLDPTLAGEMADLLLEQINASGATLLFSTHWVSLVSEKVDRLIGLREGRVLIDAPPADVAETDLTTLYEGSPERH
jgi:phosphonate transport system ATP-binding protein